MKLRDGDRIAVIGAGPAGTFFSFLASEIAARLGLKVSITIFDGKDFEQPGPPGCNMCAGVISETLAEKLHQIGLSPPGDRIQVEVENYLLCTPYYNISLYKRRRRFPIHTVYRGNGPRDRTSTENVSFDDYLLDKCRARDVAVIPEMISDLVRPNEESQPVTLKYGANGQLFSAELVVIACGLNTRLLVRLQELGFHYKPPKTVHTCQAEIQLPEDFMRDKIAQGITTFALEKGNTRFAAFTPKQQHLTLSVIGKRDVSPEDLLEVLEDPRIKEDFLQGLPAGDRFCFCRPKIAISAARHVYTDRFVVIGDAAFSRYYKNGIESAFDTARAAATCALEKGISAQAFRRYYMTRQTKTVKYSSNYGKLLFRFYDLIFRSHLLSAGVVSLLAHPRRGYSSRQMATVLWSIFTGNVSYRKILRRILNPRIQARLALETTRVTLRKILLGQGALGKGRFVSREVDPLGPLASGQTVAIIGGGPGGVGCAVALKKFSAARGVNLNVVIYEGKDFETQPHYNQCVGVLSPPIVEILEKELGIPFPYHLIQREITGYVLHSDCQSLLLPGNQEVSFAVRRVTFDSYLLNAARKRDIELIKSRVTDIEIGEEGVMVYSETDNRRADVVVGAFGLDDGTAKVFERTTAYRQPRFLNSIVTKIHPGEEFVNDYENHIHAFLPSTREIEFGAVTPKKNHLTINVAGSEVTAESLRNFLGMAEVLKVLPDRDIWDPAQVSYFKGRFPIRVAKGFYGNRYVTVGDAAGLLRPFKGKGVNSAILTGMRAALTLLDQGISRRAFQSFHAKCRDITTDLPYGKFMRFIALRMANWKALDPILEIAKHNRKLERALFNSISAHQTFKIIMREFWDVKLFWNAARAILAHWLRLLRDQVIAPRLKQN